MYFVSPVVGRRETGRGTNRAVYVNETAADSTDQMMMVVADPILEARWRTGGLNAPDEALGDQDVQSVVHRLQ